MKPDELTNYFAKYGDNLPTEIAQAVTDADLGAVPMPMIPADFGKLIAEETDKWGKVAKSAGIKPI